MYRNKKSALKDLRLMNKGASGSFWLGYYKCMHTFSSDRLHLVVNKECKKRKKELMKSIKAKDLCSMDVRLYGMKVTRKSDI